MTPDSDALNSAVARRESPFGLCLQMGTDIQIGPTGKTLLPLSVV